MDEQAAAPSSTEPAVEAPATEQAAAPVAEAPIAASAESVAGESAPTAPDPVASASGSGAAGEQGNVGTSAGAATDVAAAGEAGNVDTGAPSQSGAAPVDTTSSHVPSTDSDANAGASGTQATGAVVSDPLTQYVAEMAPVYQALGAAAEPTDAQQVAADSVAIAAAPVEPADISKGEVTPIDGAEPTAADHPAHLSLLKIELFAERIPSDFMQELKRLVAEVRGFL